MKPIALIYDADKTLFAEDLPNMLLRQSGIEDIELFWNGVNQQRSSEQCPSLAYIRCLLEAGCDLSEENLRHIGAEANMYRGLPDFFDRINTYAAQRSLNAEHYIVSAGLQGLIEGSMLADRLTKVYACQLDHTNWPTTIVNDTMKTGHLADIYKGVPHNPSITRNTKGARYVQYHDMLIFGDGDTDVPMLVFGKDKGAHCFAVYDQYTEKAQRLYEENRVHHIVKADYREGSELDQLVKQRIDQL